MASVIWGEVCSQKEANDSLRAFWGHEDILTSKPLEKEAVNKETEHGWIEGN